ncbi:hypothetical protein LZ30DRAFT_722204 [Colletotrichum cereale]|nr:hypothetical protein LZ30DRAFT_722204 [Colletotrichum cereale]
MSGFVAEATMGMAAVLLVVVVVVVGLRGGMSRGRELNASDLACRSLLQLSCPLVSGTSHIPLPVKVRCLWWAGGGGSPNDERRHPDARVTGN